MTSRPRGEPTGDIPVPLDTKDQGYADRLTALAAQFAELAVSAARQGGGFQAPVGGSRGGGGTGTAPTSTNATTVTPARTTGGGGGGGTTTSGTTTGSTPEPPAFVAATIPGNGKLIRISNPIGSDDTDLFFVEYTVNGVPIQFEIGNRARFDELFTFDMFPSYETLSQTQFDQRDGLVWGTIDEQLGNSESLQSQVERGVREAGFEDIPAWQQGSPEVMTIIMTAAREGWSPGRAIKEIAGTQAFATRYPGFEAWRQIVGDAGSLSDAISSYVGQEDKFKGLLRRFRGPNTDISNEYVGQLIATGWTDQEVGEVLDFEQRLVGTPEALDNLNEILTFNGFDPVDAVGLLELSQGRGSPEVLETLNDALRQAELEGQGLNVGAGLAAALGSGSLLGLQSQEEIRAQAQAVALDIFANRRDMDLGRFGVTEESILRAAFNGEASAEVASTLSQLARERAAAAQGFEDANAFQSDRGRVQVVGLGNL